MSFIYIDRRLAGKGKSSSNRQRLIKRIKGFIKTSLPQNIGAGGVSGSKSPGSSSPVKVAGSALEEPWFAYANDGDIDLLLIGNPEFDRGDIVDVDQNGEGQGGNGAGDGENGQDDFVVNVARDEFLNIYFEDCELPNLENERYTDKLENESVPAGFSTNGTPAQLSIIRTYKQSLARRRALGGPYSDEIAELRLELQQLQDSDSNPDRISEIEDRIEVLLSKIAAITGFDDMDLRYRKKGIVPLKTTDAVLFMLMDISGSMSEEKKRIARRWFALLYAFIKRKHPDIELIPIAHTTEAYEMSEDDFFSTTMNGGTAASSALVKVNEIIKKRFDPNKTNIYICHASDGDNWDNDNQIVYDEMLGAGHLANKIKFFSYIEVGKVNNSWHPRSNTTNLWDVYADVKDELPAGKMSLAVIEQADDCYQIFKRVFKKER